MDYKLGGVKAGEGTGWESAYNNLCQFGEEESLSFLLNRREMLVSFGNSVVDLPGAEISSWKKK